MRFEMGKLQLFGVDLSALWQRWVRGLSSILPAGLGQVFLRPAPALRVRCTEQQVSFERVWPESTAQPIVLEYSDLALARNDALQSQLVGGRGKVSMELNVVLPEQQLMRRTLRLPPAVRGHLRETVSYQISRLTPFKAEQVFFDAREVSAASADSNDMIVELVVVLKSYAEPLIAQIEQLTGLKVSRLQAPAAAGADAGCNLLGTKQTPSFWWRRLNRNSALLAVLMVAIGAAVLTPALKLRYEVVQRKQEIAQLDQRVTGLREMRNTLDRDVAMLNYIVNERTAQGQLVKVLDELALIIPDAIHLSSLAFNQQTLVLNGMGTQVVDLIDVLNASPLFTEAKFTSAVNRSRDGLDVFTVSLRLVSEVEQP